jgi:predicted transcriptional regulator
MEENIGFLVEAPPSDGKVFKASFKLINVLLDNKEVLPIYHWLYTQWLEGNDFDAQALSEHMRIGLKAVTRRLNKLSKLGLIDYNQKAGEVTIYSATPEERNV